MRRKLALIFGTPIAITLVLVAIYYSKVQQKIEPVISPPDTMEEETEEFKIIEGWSTYTHPTEGFLIDIPPNTRAVESGKSLSILPYEPSLPFANILIEDNETDYSKLPHINVTSEPIEINGIPGKLLTETYTEGPYGYKGAKCITYQLEHSGKFYKIFLYECLHWEDFERVVQSFRFPKSQSIQKPIEDIAEVNNRFNENKKNCKPDEWCTFEYLFRDDHFQFDLAYNESPSFSGDAINIRYNDTDDTQNSRSLMSIVILEGSESRYFSGLESEEEDVLLNGVPATKYVISDCTNYRLTYKDKTYYFLGHEFCAGRVAEKIIGTFQFYETKK